jgi:hypothetical protein
MPPDHDSTSDHKARFGNRASHVAALMAIAAAIALVAPGRTDGLPEDALADGIIAAQRCDAENEPGSQRWADCIRRQETGLAASVHASVGLHFQAWLTADRIARDGRPAASELGAAHAHRVVRALDENLLTLHRLCTASGLDCEALGERLAEAM